MDSAPQTIRITYQRHRETGLLCAFSNDLKGLLVFGRTEEQLQEKIPPICDALVREQFGQDCSYHWTSEDEEDEGVAPGFVPPDSLGTLVPEQACA
jgi:hypothetical protein